MRKEIEQIQEEISTSACRIEAQGVIKLAIGKLKKITPGPSMFIKLKQNESLSDMTAVRIDEREIEQC